MTGKTGAPDVRQVVTLVAGVASRTLMRAGERKASAAVIELRLGPVDGAMTRRAIGPQLSVVYVICPVAVNAFRWCPAMWQAGGMAIAAGDI